MQLSSHASGREMPTYFLPMMRHATSYKSIVHLEHAKPQRPARRTGVPGTVK